MFVSGPVGTSVIGSSEARIVSAMKSTACRGSGSVVGAGSDGPSIPLSPWTYSATNGSRLIGLAAPAATGTSVRPVNSSSFSALTVVFSSVWLPWTVVTPTSSTSGLASASRRAIASSWPGSQSSRIFMPAVFPLPLRPWAGKAARPGVTRRSPRRRRRGVSASSRGRPSRSETRRQAVNASPAAVPSTASTGGGTARAISFPPSRRTAPSAPSVSAVRPSWPADRLELVAVDHEQVDLGEQGRRQRPGRRGVQAQEPGLRGGRRRPSRPGSRAGRGRRPPRPAPPPPRPSAFAPGATTIWFSPSAATTISATPVGAVRLADAGEVDAALVEQRQRLAREGIAPDRAGHRDARAEPRRRERLVRSLPAGHALEGRVGQRLPRPAAAARSARRGRG